MRRLAALALCLAIALASSRGEAKKKRVVVDRIVAIVDDTAITKSALDRETRSARKQVEQKYALDSDARAAAMREVERAELRAMIDTRLLLKAAAKLRLSASKEEIDRAVADVAKQNARTVPELMQAVVREGYDEVDYRRRLGEQIVTWRVAQQEAYKRTPEMSKLSPEEQQRRIAAAMTALVSDLRSAAHIEERL